MSFITALVIFGLTTLMLVGFIIMYTYATQGFGFGFSANRPVVEKSEFGQRIERVYKNQVDSAAYIVPVLVAAHLTGLEGSGPSLAAALIAWGRVAFAALYYTGISFVRVPAFVLGTFPSLYLAVLVLMQA